MVYDIFEFDDPELLIKAIADKTLITRDILIHSNYPEEFDIWSKYASNELSNQEYIFCVDKLISVYEEINKTIW